MYAISTIIVYLTLQLQMSRLDLVKKLLLEGESSLMVKCPDMIIINVISLQWQHISVSQPICSIQSVNVVGSFLYKIHISTIVPT